MVPSNSAERSAQTMTSSTLLLVRHGHTAANHGGPSSQMSGWADVPLSTTGRWQARAVACRLARCAPGAAIYASPLARTRWTAQSIANAVRADVRLSDALQEIYCGAVDGLRIADVQARYRERWEANERQDNDD